MHGFEPITTKLPARHGMSPDLVQIVDDVARLQLRAPRTSSGRHAARLRLRRSRCARPERQQHQLPLDGNLGDAHGCVDIHLLMELGMVAHDALRHLVNAAVIVQQAIGGLTAVFGLCRVQGLLARGRGDSVKLTHARFPRVVATNKLTAKCRDIFQRERPMPTLLRNQLYKRKS